MPESRACEQCACSGGNAFVAMMESAHLRDFHDAACRSRLDRSADGCVLALQQLRPGSFVIFKVGFPDAPQSGFIEKDDRI